MAKQLFNEAETYLLENWTDARLLEKSLVTMRKKYAAVLVKVLDEVKKRHPDFDCRGMEFRVLDEDNDDDCDCVNIGVGKKAWPSASRRNWPSGLWICGITLGEIVAHGEGFPTASVWINPPEDSTVDLTSVGHRLEEEAKRLLPERTVTHTVDKEDGWVSIDYSLPESRNALLELLLKGESQGFIKCLVAHFETLTKLVPAIDQIFPP